jgi:hypothetical protein
MYNGLRGREGEVMQVTGQLKDINKLLTKAIQDSSAFIYMEPPNKSLMMDLDGNGYTFLSNGIFVSHPIVLSYSAFVNLKTMLSLFRKQQKNHGKKLPNSSTFTITNKDITLYGNGESTSLEYETNAVVLSYDNPMSRRLASLSQGLLGNQTEFIKMNTNDLKQYVIKSENKGKEYILTIREGDVVFDGTEVKFPIVSNITDGHFIIPKSDLDYILRAGHTIASTEVAFILSKKMIVIELYSGEELLCKIHKRHL